jgi:type II secretory pathway pseudopilin PulG
MLKMASTIITTTDAPRARVAQPKWAAFTLAEVMVSMTLSAVIMAAVLSSFLMMSRSGINAYNYVGMESEARRGLEQFGEDVRMAYKAVGTSTQDLTLWMSSATSANASTDVRYYYDTSTSSANYQCLVRTGPDRVTGTVSTRVLIHNVQSDMVFTRWVRGVPPSRTTDLTGGNTWQLQLSLTIKKTNGSDRSLVAATNLVVSARYILRNKS